MPTEEEILKQVNKSGFPFQLKIAHEIDTTSGTHNFQVLSQEHPWSVPERNKSGFADIVIGHNEISTIRIVIECKKFSGVDSRRLRWIFLIPSTKTVRPTDSASCYEVEARKAFDRERPGTGATRWYEFQDWDDVHLFPESSESGFCIQEADKEDRPPMLEKLAFDVLASVEGMALEERNLLRSREGATQGRLFMFPLIVTNAELFITQFDPASVDVETGAMDVNSVQIEAVPFIRFRKSLSTDFPKGPLLHLKHANQARERTVMIVNASALPDFLSKWRLPDQRFALLEFLRQHSLTAGF